MTGMAYTTYALLVLMALSVVTVAANKKCSYTFRVPAQDMHAGCTSTAPVEAIGERPEGATGAGQQQVDQLVASLQQLLENQRNVLDTELLLKRMNATVREQDVRYSELVKRTRQLSSQLSLLTSGHQKHGGAGKGIFPGYSGVTSKYSGCPEKDPSRIHEIAPIRKIYEEIIRVVPRSCFEWKLMGHIRKGSYRIDPDGLEGAPPFNTECIISASEVITIVKHNYVNRTHVTGYEGPGSYVAEVDYHGVTTEQIRALIGVSRRCEQYLKYECKGSTLSNQGWWVSWDGKQQEHWAGGSSTLGGCACNIERTCTNYGQCNCDSNDDQRWNEDAGYVTDMDILPVTRLQFGDTGGNTEEGYFSLGPLRCYSDAVSPYSTTNAFLPLETWPPFDAFCDFAGWMVIMRHNQFGSVDFDTNLKSYQDGFGDLNSDFWLGLDRIYQMTNQKNKWYALQVTIDNGSGVKFFAKYDYFKIANVTDQYRLHVSGYSGTAPDEMHNMDGMTFTAKDQDADNWQGGNCAESHGGGWWWYDCGYVMLTSSTLGWGGLTDVESVELKIKLSEFN